MNLKEESGRILLRFSMASVFLLFGINQVYAPTQWVGFVPQFLTNLLSPGLIVILNGSLEIILSLFLFFGIYRRGVSLILGAHLLAITLTLGFTPLAIRDMGLSLATFSIAFFKPDRFCLGSKRVKINSEEEKIISGI